MFPMVSLWNFHIIWQVFIFSTSHYRILLWPSHESIVEVESSQIWFQLWRLTTVSHCTRKLTCPCPYKSWSRFLQIYYHSKLYTVDWSEGLVSVFWEKEGSEEMTTGELYLLKCLHIFNCNILLKTINYIHATSVNQHTAMNVLSHTHIQGCVISVVMVCTRTYYLWKVNPLSEPQETILVLSEWDLNQAEMYSYLWCQALITT